MVTKKFKEIQKVLKGQEEKVWLLAEAIDFLQK